MRYSSNMESYFDPKHPASFGGVNKFHEHLDKKFTRKQTQVWMINDDCENTMDLNYGYCIIDWICFALSFLFWLWVSTTFL